MGSMRAVVMGMMILSAAPMGWAQSRPRGADAGREPATRYFELKLVLRFPASGAREERVESLTTDVAVLKDRPGASSCRARLISQVPVTMQKGPTYLDVGTKFDCNDVRVEGDALLMGIVLETSSVNGTVTTESKDGRRVEEPLISERNLALQAKLPLGKPTVVFDSKNMEPAAIKPLPGGGAPAAPLGGGQSAGTPPRAEMQVEMTARELP